LITNYIININDPPIEPTPKFEIVNVLFSDGKEFGFTLDQILLIGYFKNYFKSNMYKPNISFDKRKNIYVNTIYIFQSSSGFEYLHEYSTLGELDINIPREKIICVIAQCNYFMYDKFQNYIASKYKIINVIFSDGNQFEFTLDQILLITYFKNYFDSDSNSESDISFDKDKYIQNIKLDISSYGFKYLHKYATSGKSDIIIPDNEIYYVEKQCEYFKYDKFKKYITELYKSITQNTQKNTDKIRTINKIIEYDKNIFTNIGLYKSILVT